MKLLQIHPIMKCNRQCSFCSYRDEKTEGTLPFFVIANHLRQAAMLGCKEIKFSGGGEPLLHPHIVSIFRMAKCYGFKIYLQTNGTLLEKVHRSLCDDIRFSYGDGVYFIDGHIKPDGYSYIITDTPDYENLTRLIQYATLHDLYVRVTFDDTGVNAPSPDEVLSHIPSLHRHNGATAVPITHKHTLWNNKYFHVGQNPCLSSMETPLLGADGYWYPCCRTQFALERKVWGYNKEMRMGTGELPLEPYDGSSCVSCSYDLSN
ncbi:MAG: radical SAM protein [Deltaproteobacteria bacterium]|nr:radical SAM protein [Deltaproteobacteria bacterium]